MQAFSVAPLLQGVRDSFEFPLIWRTARNNPKMYKALVRVVKINFLFFLGHSFLLAFLTYFSSLVLSNPQLSWVEQLVIKANFAAINFVVNVVGLVVYLAIAYPNSTQVSRITAAFEKNVIGTETNVGAPLHAVVYDILMIFVGFNTVITLVSCIPWIGTPLSFIYSCWLNSFYCWNYKRRLRTGKCEVDNMQVCWMYHLGFGAVLTLATWWLPLITGLGVFATLFPFYICMAQKSSAVPYQGSFYPHKIYIFKEAVFLTEYFWLSVIWLLSRDSVSKRLKSNDFGKLILNGVLSDPELRDTNPLIQN